MPDESFTELLPIVDDSDDVIKGSRIGSVSQARDIYCWLRDADEDSRYNRAKLQVVLDGAPPADPAKLRKSGQSGIANVNIGLLKHFLTESTRPLLDQINKSEKFLNIKLKQFGDEDLSAYASIIEEEHFNMVTREPSFNFRKQNLVRQYVTHGVVVPYWEDDRDWRWKSEPLGEFVIPHMTEATEDAIEVACMRQTMKPHELVFHLNHDSEHWDKDEIMRTLRSAKHRDGGSWDDPEREVAKFKDNDLWASSKLSEIRVVHLWVKELDGAVSHFIFTEDGSCDEFLYKHEKRFSHQSEAFQVMTYGVGTNGYYHSIRGLGYDALPLVQEINRLISSMIDAMRTQGKLPIKPTTEDAAQNLRYMEFAGFSIMPRNYEVVSAPVPNYSQTLFPGIGMLMGMLNQSVSSYSVEGRDGMGDSRKTQAEVMARLQQMSQMSSGNAELFNAGWARLLKKQAEKIFSKNYRKEFRGGEEVADMKRRCEERGVPPEVWDLIDLDGTTVVPAVGAGSAAYQTMILERLLTFLGQGFFDAEGEERLKRMAVRMITNNEITKSLCGDGHVGRPTNDDRFALLENNSMSDGKPVVVLPNDMHLVHLAVHLGAYDAEVPTGSIADDLGVLQQAMQADDEQTIVELTPIITYKHQHAVEHLGRVQQSPQAARYRQQLQQIGGMLENVQKRAAAIQRRMAQEQAEQDAVNPEGAVPRGITGQWNLAESLNQSQNKLRQNQVEFEQRMRFREEEFRQELDHKDRAKAMDLQLKLAENAGNQLIDE